MIELFLDRYVYLFVLLLLAVGLYGVLAMGDLVKKVIGLTIFSTAIYIFFIEGSVQEGGTAPVIDEGQTDPGLYVDPLPHLLILTAIVVGVGVVGVALSLLVRLYRVHGTLDESVIAARLAGRAEVPAGTAVGVAAAQDDAGAATDEDAGSEGVGGRDDGHDVGPSGPEGEGGPGRERPDPGQGPDDADPRGHA